jgi:hypothetical protein
MPLTFSIIIIIIIIIVAVWAMAAENIKRCFRNVEWKLKRSVTFLKTYWPNVNYCPVTKLPDIILSNLGLFVVVVFINPYAAIPPSLYTQIYILHQTDYCYGYYYYYYYYTGCFFYRLTEYDVFIA